MKLLQNMFSIFGQLFTNWFLTLVVTKQLCDASLISSKSSFSLEKSTLIAIAIYIVSYHVVSYCVALNRVVSYCVVSPLYPKNPTFAAPICFFGSYQTYMIGNKYPFSGKKFLRNDLSLAEERKPLLNEYLNGVIKLKRISESAMAQAFFKRRPGDPNDDEPLLKHHDAVADNETASIGENAQLVPNDQHSEGKIVLFILFKQLIVPFEWTLRYFIDLSV